MTVESAAAGDIIVGTPERLVAVRYQRPKTFNSLRVTPQYGPRGARVMQAGARAIVDEIADWKAWAATEENARAVPIDGPVTVVVEELRLDRRWLPDTGAPYIAAKAMLDGLVQAKYLPGDGPDIVTELRFKAPLIVGVYGLRLTITSVPGGTPGLF